MEGEGPASGARPSAVDRVLDRLHRGELEAAAVALADAERAGSAGSMYVEQLRAQLAALGGRPFEALQAADRLRDAVADHDALYLVGRAEVFRGWTLWLMCDPSAVDALERGDQVAQHDLLGLRLRYLRGRHALLEKDADRALEAAGALIGTTRSDPRTRYQVLVALLEVEAQALVSSRPIDQRRLQTLLTRSLDVARPEAWRIAARLGNSLDRADLIGWSCRRLDELVAQSGPFADTVRFYAGRFVSRDR